MRRGMAPEARKSLRQGFDEQFAPIAKQVVYVTSPAH